MARRCTALRPKDLRRLTETYGDQASLGSVLRAERPDLSLPLSIPEADRRAILDAYVQMAVADARFEDAERRRSFGEADEFAVQYELASERMEGLVSELESEDLEGGEDEGASWGPLPLDDVLAGMHHTYLRALESDVGVDYGDEPSRTHADIIRKEMRARGDFDERTSDAELIDAAEEVYADKILRRQKRNPDGCDAAHARFHQYLHLITLADTAEVSPGGRAEAKSFTFWALVRLSQAIDLAEHCPTLPVWYDDAQRRLELIQSVVEVLWRDAGVIMSARQAHEYGTAPFKVGDTVRCYALPARVIEIVRRAPHPTDAQRLGTWTRVERFGVVFIDDHEHRTGQG